MNSSTLWSLRLGFSGKQALEIDTLGLEQFLKKSTPSTKRWGFVPAKV